MLIGKKPCWDPYLPIFLSLGHSVALLMERGEFCSLDINGILANANCSVKSCFPSQTQLTLPLFSEKRETQTREPKKQQALLRIRISTRQPFYITLTGLLKGALVWRENVFSWGRMLIGTGRAVEQLVLNLFTAKSTILIISVVGSLVGPAALTA